MLENVWRQSSEVDTHVGLDSQSITQTTTATLQKSVSVCLVVTYQTFDKRMSE